MIATFPSFQSIALEDRTTITDLLAQYPPQASEYTFTNLFAWRYAARYQIARHGDGVLIRKESSGSMSFLQPLVPPVQRLDAVRDCLAYLQGKTAVPCLERVGEDFFVGLDRATLPFHLEEERDQFDYLYTVRDLVDLAGPKFHDKRNLLTQFQRKYAYRYRPLDAALAKECIAFAHAWCVDRRCEESEGLAQEQCAVVQMLHHFAALRLGGGAIDIDGKLVAFTLAEPLNPDTLVIHAEKGKARVTGIYQAINQEFLSHQAGGFTYVNREQDLGEAGLRKAKLSYNPVRMVAKYRLTER